MLALVLLLTLPPGAPLREPTTGTLIGTTPFMESLIFIIALGFLERKLDNVTAAKAAGLAVLFNAVKPKNLLLAIAAGVTVAQVGASAVGQACAIAVFVALGTAGLGIPLAIDVLMPTRGRDVLIAMRDWMVRENATIIAVLSLVIAAKLLGDALVSLAA